MSANMIGISPALNVDLSSVLFSSSLDMDKRALLDYNSSQIDTTDTTEWKLTLRDRNKILGLDGRAEKSNSWLDVPYYIYDRGEKKANQISVMITDKKYTDSSAQILYYGAMRDTQFSEINYFLMETGRIVLPDDLYGKELGSDYHVYILAEYINSGNGSDYASDLVEITEFDEMIQSIDITGLNTPSPKEELDKDVTLSSYPENSIASSDLKWYLGDTEVTGNAGYNKTYTAKITLTPAKGFKFADTVCVTLKGDRENISYDKNDDGTLTITYTFPATAAKRKVKEVKDPKTISVPNGSSLEDIKSALPKQVEVVTEDNITVAVSIAWDLDVLGYKYDPTKLEAQTFFTKGYLSDEEVDLGDPYGYDHAFIEIIVLAADSVETPTVDVAADTYTENKSVTLRSATDEAKIYYTTDGSDPEIDDDGNPTGNTKLYDDSSISVTGRQGESVATTIRAIAVKPGMLNSAEAVFTYTITLPHVHGFDNAEWKSDGTKHWKECTNSNCDKSEGYKVMADCSGGTATYFQKAVCSTCDREYGILDTDVTPPTGEIKVSNNVWNSFLNTITFGFFFKDTKKVEITGTDDSYLADGFAEDEHKVRISYLLVRGDVADGCTTSELYDRYENGDFKNYTEAFNINPDNRYVVYARIEDHAGNVTFLSSDGMVGDTTAPVINGIANDKTYCEKAEFTVTEENLEKVTDTKGSETITLTAKDGKYTLSAGTHKVTAVDKAGNSTVVIFTVDLEHNYETPVYTWKGVTECTAEMICAVCKKKVAETGEAVAKVTQEKTCTLPELTTYTVVFTKEAFSTQTKVEQTKEAGHTWNSDYTEDKKPGCTTEGSKSIHCKNCDAVKDNKVVAATGHVPGEWIVDKAATVEEAGSRHKECTVCGEILEIEEIKKLEPQVYKILDGADSSWTPKTEKSLSIRGNGEVTKFIEVKVDGKVVDSKYYTITEGSTIVTFHEDFLKSLPEGEHSFELVWTDGSATTSFEVAKNTTEDQEEDTKKEDIKKEENKKQENVSTVKTGDTSDMTFWMLVCTLSLAGLIRVLVRSKKKNSR